MSKLKVVESQMSSTYLVVRQEYGEERTAENGVKYRYEPLPLCRVPDGWGRDREESKTLAEHICNLLERQLQHECESVEPGYDPLLHRLLKMDITKEDEVMELTAQPPVCDVHDHYSQDDGAAIPF